VPATAPRLYAANKRLIHLGQLIDPVPAAPWRAAAREDLRFHDMRHTTATWIAMHGYDTRTLMRIADHLDPQTAMTYTNPPPRLRAAVEAIMSPPPIRIASKAGAEEGAKCAKAAHGRQEVDDRGAGI